MTTTLTPATTLTDPTPAAADHPVVWRTGLAAGAAAGVATTAVAALAEAAGVSFESAPGEAIPLPGFFQLTLAFVMVGALLARVVARRAADPRRTFVRLTAGLTALSLVPDLVTPFDGASRAVLVLTHLVAAAIAIPALARRLEGAAA